MAESNKGEKMQLTIKTHNDEKDVEVFEETLVKELKEVVAYKFGVYIDQVALLCAGNNRQQIKISFFFYFLDF